MSDDSLLRLFQRLHDCGVEYVLVGGQAVRLNGYLRATEDIDIVVRASRDNAERIKRALDFLPAAREIDSAWFEPVDGEVENIRIADDLVVDLLFSANGETYESLTDSIKELLIDGVPVRVLDIDGLLRTKTNYREKDVLDRQVLLRIKQQLRLRT